MRLTRYTLAILAIFLIFSSSISVMAASVGVQLGHWAKYTLTGFLGEPGATSETISILRVSVSIVEYTRTLEYAHRSPFTDSFRGDVSQGTALPYIVPANLHEGDTIYDYPVLSKVEGITTRSYAGSSRTVVYATWFGDKYYWDQQTGILVEGNVSPYSRKLTETNIWGGGIFDTSNPFFWALIVIIVVIAAALALVVLSSLRKKKPITERVTPPSSPEEKSAKTKYCPKCGTNIPLDAIYCPKCAHKQP